MKQPPAGWPRISSSIYYDDPRAAIDWLCAAFGFEVRLKVEDEAGGIAHSELTYGEGLIMVGGTRRRTAGKDEWQAQHATPTQLDGKVTQAMCIFVDDADAHFARALEAGAQVMREPKTDNYGDDYLTDRSYGVRDPEGHHWWFMQRIKG